MDRKVTLSIHFHLFHFLSLETSTNFLSSRLAVSTSLGPIIGSTIALNLGYKWCFLILIPTMTISTILMIFCHRPPTLTLAMRGKKTIREMDPIGNISLVLSCLGVLLALQFSSTDGKFNSIKVIFPFILSGIFTVIFCINMYMVDEKYSIFPRGLRNQTIVLSASMGFAVLFSETSIIYYLPLYLQVPFPVNSSP